MSVAKPARPTSAHPSRLRLKSQRKKWAMVGSRGEPDVEGDSFISVLWLGSVSYAWANVSARGVASNLPASSSLPAGGLASLRGPAGRRREIIDRKSTRL